MKTKSPKSHNDRGKLRPMCAQYSLSDSLLAAFGQTDKNSEVSPAKTPSHHSPTSEVNIQPIKGNRLKVDLNGRILFDNEHFG